MEGGIGVHDPKQLLLKYSFRIAVKMLRKMEELKLSKQELATQLDMSEEYLAKILKGQENLTLETIAKIEKALGLQFMAIQDKRQEELLEDE